MAIGTVPSYLQNASHSASVFRIAQSAPFTSGGILASNELPVSQQASPNMSVILGPGRAQINGTSVSPPAGQAWSTQSMYTAYNDANLTLTIAASNPTNPRIDSVYVQIQDAFYSGSTNTAVAAVATGTPAVSPVAPSIPANSILIANIAVAANATTIVTANISYQASVASLLANAATTAAIGAIGTTGVVPTGVVVGSGSYILGAKGVVTFTGASSVSINGCFTTAYDNYLILFDFTTSGAGTLNPTLRLSGLDATTAYDTQRATFVNATVSAAQTLNASNWVGSGGLGTAGGRQFGEMVLYKPALAVATGGTIKNNLVANPMTSADGRFEGTLQHRTATAYDGFTFTPSTGTITGTIRIYGYNNN